MFETAGNCRMLTCICWAICIISIIAISPLQMLKAKINLNLKIVVQMSEWSQMAELDNLSKSETPNLATLHRLACTES